MFVTRTSSDVQLMQIITTYYAFFMLLVLLLSTLNYHIHNPDMLLSVGQVCSNTFAGVIFEDTNQDGKLGLNEYTLDGLVTLRSQTDSTIQKYETDRGRFIPRNIACGIYEVSYENVLVGEVEVGLVMSAEIYSFAGPNLEIIGVDYDFPYQIYLPYIVR